MVEASNTTAKEGSAMTGLVVHQCPKCELRFSFRTELEYHLKEDHPAPAIPHDTTDSPDTGRAGETSPAPLPAVRPVAVRGDGSTSKRRLAALVCAIATVALVAYVAIVISNVWTAVVITALVVALATFYVRHARGRARIPRR
jgi:Flp pilus assembly protein TadB